MRRTAANKPSPHTFCQPRRSSPRLRSAASCFCTKSRQFDTPYAIPDTRIFVLVPFPFTIPNLDDGIWQNTNTRLPWWLLLLFWMAERKRFSRFAHTFSLWKISISESLRYFYGSWPLIAAQGISSATKPGRLTGHILQSHRRAASSPPEPSRLGQTTRSSNLTKYCRIIHLPLGQSTEIPRIRRGRSNVS